MALLLLATLFQIFEIVSLANKSSGCCKRAEIGLTNTDLISLQIYKRDVVKMPVR